MKVLFIQQQLFPYFGLMSLSGCLRASGHETYLLIDSELRERDLFEKISEISPDLIGFSLMSTEHEWFVAKGGALKQRFPSTPIVAGGIHAILYPEDLARLPFADFVCYGEGEATILQLLQHLKGDLPLDGVKGLAFERDGELCKTELNSFTQLDEFPEDRQIYYDSYKALRDLPLKVFVSSRGCPYRCTFCVNPYLQNVFKGLGRYIRRKSAAGFVAEIEKVAQTYGIKSLFIADDLFAMDRNWLSEFSRLYKQKVAIPYICTARADMIDEEVAGLLRDSGCHTVTFGVETGKEELRIEILKKNITDAQLMNAAALLTRAGLRYQTSNMFCLPGETIDDAVKTIDLNIKMGTSYTMSAIFLPFPKTELTDLCIRMGVLKPDYTFSDMPHSFIKRSVLALKDKDTLELLQKVAGLAIQYPKLRNPMVFLARHVRIYPLHFFLYLVGTVLRFRSERKLSLLDTLRYVWSYRKSA